MEQFTEKDYVNAHGFSSKHSDDLKKDRICGCFYCLSIFSPDEIKQWLTERKPTDQTKKEWSIHPQKTAFCPHCGVDSIIGESSGYPITKQFLKEMHQRWFE